METPKIDTIPGLNGCVFKLFWGEKYVIIKCKTFLRAKTLIEQNFGYFEKYNHIDKHYNPLFEYIKAHPFHNFRTEILFESDNPYQLLIQEQLALWNAQEDNNCLNIFFDAYVPKGIQGKGKKWVNRGHYLNFRNWLKKHRKNAVT